MTRDEFYEACAKIIGVEHQYTDRTPVAEKWDRKTGTFYRPMTRAGRRTGREAGNGRYPNVGVIRDFGSHVHVVLHTPVSVVRTFDNHDDSLAFLRLIFAHKNLEKDC